MAQFRNVYSDRNDDEIFCLGSPFTCQTGVSRKWTIHRRVTWANWRASGGGTSRNRASGRGRKCSARGVWLTTLLHHTTREMPSWELCQKPRLVRVRMRPRLHCHNEGRSGDLHVRAYSNWRLHLQQKRLQVMLSRGPPVWSRTVLGRQSMHVYEECKVSQRLSSRLDTWPQRDVLLRRLVCCRCALSMHTYMPDQTKFLR